LAGGLLDSLLRLNSLGANTSTVLLTSPSLNSQRVAVGKSLQPRLLAEGLTSVPTASSLVVQKQLISLLPSVERTHFAHRELLVLRFSLGVKFERCLSGFRLGFRPSGER
jgi:hypothetical protein